MEQSNRTKRRKRSRFSSTPVKEDTPPQPKSSVPTSSSVVPVQTSTATTAANSDQNLASTKPLKISALNTTRVPSRRKLNISKRKLPQHNTAAKSIFSANDDDDSDDNTGDNRNTFTSNLGKKIPLRTKKLPLNLKESEDKLDPIKHTNSNVDDPLEAYMQTLEKSTSKKRAHSETVGDPTVSPASSSTESPNQSDDESNRPRTTPKRSVYQKIDHSTIHYPSFRKDLYIEVPEITQMTHAEVAVRRRALGNIRIRGRHCARPVSTWAQCGLAGSILSVLERHGFNTPTPIQAQALPCIMSGRDVIGVARTGSGKTLAFLLPALRHIALQQRAGPGDGPTALIIAPTRELAIQIYGDARRFAKAVNIRSACAYGGSAVKDQIAELKRGADIVICTPGRMIDLLAMNSGRITNLKRVTFIVLDEADRMFDMGFEPQLMRIVENIRPDKQTVMFSATFPQQVEKLARKILKQPIEIMVGGNSIAAATIDQHVEVLSEDLKFLRLLELLGIWYDKGSTLVFVDRQDNADRIYRDLSKARYKCLSLHGGLDQADRDSTIVDFKNGDIKVLVATSVAARGLDVKNLSLVVNFDVPSHYEDYVHRVGRTGRAGKSGTAYTFITPDQEAFAGDLVKALELSARSAAEQEAPEGDPELAKKCGNEAAAAAVPEELRKLKEGFELKRKAGIVKYGPSSGYGGRGFKFDENEEYDAAKKAMRKMQAKQYGIEDELGDDGDQDGDEEKKNTDMDDENENNDDDIFAIDVAPKPNTNVKNVAQRASDKTTDGVGTTQVLNEEDVGKLLRTAVAEAHAKAEKQNLDEDKKKELIAKAQTSVLAMVASQNKNPARVPAAKLSTTRSDQEPVTSATSAAINAAAVISAQASTTEGSGMYSNEANVGDSETSRFAAELEINDYPQHARWQVTRKGSLNDVEEFTGCVVTTRGNFYPTGRNPPAGQRKLHFLIEGPTKHAVRTARRDIKQKLEEASAISRPDDNQYSKYSVV